MATASRWWPAAPTSWPSWPPSCAARASAAEVLAADLTDRDGPRRAARPASPSWASSPTSSSTTPGSRPSARSAKADPAAEMNMIEVDVVAVVDLCMRFLPGHGRARAGRHLERRLDRGVPAAARPGRLRRLQGVRALLHPQPRRRAARHRRHRHRAVPRSGRHRLRRDRRLRQGGGRGVAAQLHVGDARGRGQDAASTALDKGHPVAIPGAANRVGANVRPPRPQARSSSPCSRAATPACAIDGERGASAGLRRR